MAGFLMVRPVAVGVTSAFARWMEARGAITPFTYNWRVSRPLGVFATQMPGPASDFDQPVTFEGARDDGVCVGRDVDIGAPDELCEHRGLVLPGPDGPDDTLIPQFDQRGDARRGGGLPVLVRVVQVNDVEAIGCPGVRVSPRSSAGCRRG